MLSDIKSQTVDRIEGDCLATTGGKMAVESHDKRHVERTCQGQGMDTVHDEVCMYKARTQGGDLLVKSRGEPRKLENILEHPRP